MTRENPSRFFTPWPGPQAWAAGVLLACMAVLAGCGGGADRTKANLRFVNASSYAALDLRVDDSLRFGGVGYGAGASYQEIDPDKTDSRITRAGSTTALLSLTPSLVRKQHVTLLAWGREGQLKTALLSDAETAAASGKARLRVFNAAADAGALDIFVTADSDPLGDAVALASAAAVGETGSLSTVDSGSWRLRVTGAGTRTDLRLDIRGLALASTAVHTLVLTPAAGGVLVNALLLTQQGEITARAVEHARVRVAAAQPAGGAVTASVGGVALMAEVASPAIGAYGWVPSGERLLTVTAAGASLPSSNVNLVAGQDYSLLVHAAGGVPAASWISEDNRRPGSSSAVKLRLVNGLASSVAALSLTAAGLPVASGVVPGAGAAGIEVAAGSAVALSVLTPGSGTPVFSAASAELLANGVYTLFVLGGPAPVGQLRQDR